jgi:hypothetical protein
MAAVKKRDDPALRQCNMSMQGTSETPILGWSASDNAKVQGIPFTYMYDLYTGDAGTIQILTFTGQNLVNEYRADIETLLNGFEVVKK